MLRARDNPPPMREGGVETYFGPAKDRPEIRVYALWCYAHIRHRATFGEAWFLVWARCACVIQMGCGFSGLDEAEAERVSAEVTTKHQRRHHPHEPPGGWPTDD